jgi:TPR repeat protein
MKGKRSVRLLPCVSTRAGLVKSCVASLRPGWAFVLFVSHAAGLPLFLTLQGCIQGKATQTPGAGVGTAATARSDEATPTLAVHRPIEAKPATGKAVSPSPQEASWTNSPVPEARLFRENKARAEQGDAEAQCKIGICYAQGVGIAQDYAQAVIWFRKAAEQGLARGQYDLGFAYARGHGVPKDGAEAVTWLRRAAEQGFAPGQYGLGVCYAKGDGVTKDYTEAAKWFGAAAEQDYAPSQNNLGICYERGSGVVKDSSQAYKWFAIASTQGFRPAETNLARLERMLGYEAIADGQYLARAFLERKASSASASTDPARSSKPEKWQTEASTAAAFLGTAPSGAQTQSLLGQTTNKLDSPSLAETRAKAEAGDAVAQNRLGLAYATGEGVATNMAGAVWWFSKAAQQGHAKAQANLGLSYLRGEDAVQNYEQAVKWLRKAAEQGDEMARTNLPRVLERSFLSTITTRDGNTYEHVVVTTVMPDALRIKYTSATGSTGFAHLRFETLPDYLQQLYGYSPERAAAYRAKQEQERVAAYQAKVEQDRATAYQAKLLEEQRGARALAQADADLAVARAKYENAKAAAELLDQLRRQQELEDLNDNLRDINWSLQQLDWRIWDESEDLKFRLRR